MQDAVLGVMAHNSYNSHYGGECNDISYIITELCSQRLSWTYYFAVLKS
jgi:hypothetical protein